MRQLSIFYLFLLSFVGYSQHIQFYQEKLDFTISENEFIVDGIYYFRNTTSDTIKQFMVYPFPPTDDLGEIITVEATTVYPSMKTPTLVNFDQKAARFRLKVLPNDTALVHIVYRQKITHQKAEYILTSTKAWNRPLERADFSLSLPFTIKIDSLSYNADSLLFRDSRLIYKFHLKDFMPDRNFCVFFSKIE